MHSAQQGKAEQGNLMKWGKTGQNNGGQAGPTRSAHDDRATKLQGTTEQRSAYAGAFLGNICMSSTSFSGSEHRAVKITVLQLMICATNEPALLKLQVPIRQHLPHPGPNWGCLGQPSLLQPILQQLLNPRVDNVDAFSCSQHKLSCSNMRLSKRSLVLTQAGHLQMILHDVLAQDRSILKPAIRPCPRI